jgi:hypothetical protein
MTDAQRKVLGHYLTVEACDPDGAVVRTRGSHAFEKITWRQLDDAIAAALADLDGYAPLRDRVEENRVWTGSVRTSWRCCTGISPGTHMTSAG